MPSPTPNNICQPYGRGVGSRIRPALSWILALAVTCAGLVSQADTALQSPPGTPNFSSALQKSSRPGPGQEGTHLRTPDPESEIPTARRFTPIASSLRRAPTSSNTPTTQSTGIHGVMLHSKPLGNAGFQSLSASGTRPAIGATSWKKSPLTIPETAKFLNENFVAVKVDREARPDIDAVYMQAVQAMGISGGWPLNVWVTPDRIPFYGGTYFPPTSQRGRAQLHADPDKHSYGVPQGPQNASRLTHKTLARELAIQLSGKAGEASFSPSISDLKNTVDRYNMIADNQWGGLQQSVQISVEPSSTSPPALAPTHRRRTDPSRRLEIP